MSYACSVCLTSVKGARCILLSCSHVFCRECLEDFWKLCIAEGDVGRVGCPDPMCVKEGREADEEEVRRVVTDDEVARWRWLGEKRSLEKGMSPFPFRSDSFLIFTSRSDHPSLSCASVPDARAGTTRRLGREWRLGTPPNVPVMWLLLLCLLSTDMVSSFRPLALHSLKAAFYGGRHGPITECPMSVTDGFIAEYMALPESSPSRLLLERRYGRSNILRLVAKVEEERANLEWLENSTMACPFCHVHVEKSMGCNHVSCLTLMDVLEC